MLCKNCGYSADAPFSQSCRFICWLSHVPFLPSSPLHRAMHFHFLSIPWRNTVTLRQSLIPRIELLRFDVFSFLLTSSLLSSLFSHSLQLYTFCLFLAFSYCQNTPSMFAAFGFQSSGYPMPVMVGLALFSQTFWSPVEKVTFSILVFPYRQRNASSIHTEWWNRYSELMMHVFWQFS